MTWSTQRQLQSSQHFQLYDSGTKTVFRYAPAVCNSLPTSLTNAFNPPSLSIFKRHLNTHFVYLAIARYCACNSQCRVADKLCGTSCVIYNTIHSFCIRCFRVSRNCTSHVESNNALYHAILYSVCCMCQIVLFAIANGLFRSFCFMNFSQNFWLN